MCGTPHVEMGELSITLYGHEVYCIHLWNGIGISWGYSWQNLEHYWDMILPQREYMDINYLLYTYIIYYYIYRDILWYTYINMIYTFIPAKNGSNKHLASSGAFLPFCDLGFQQGRPNTASDGLAGVAHTGASSVDDIGRVASKEWLEDVDWKMLRKIPSGEHTKSNGKWP